MVGVILCVIYILVLLVDMPILLKNKSKKIMVLYVIILLTAFVITGLKQAGFEIPSPLWFISVE